jgi:hypothetical protein
MANAFANDENNRKVLHKSTNPSCSCHKTFLSIDTLGIVNNKKEIKKGYKQLLIVVDAIKVVHKH